MVRVEAQITKRTKVMVLCLSVGWLVGGQSAFMAEPRHLDGPTTQAAAGTAQSSQKTFATPKEAADALVQAAADLAVSALREILGPGSEDLVSSEDSVQDKNRAAAFVAKAREKGSVRIDPKNPDRAAFLAGNDNWPLPIPIVRREGRWLFDSKAGREEILARRIGSNELDAIQICRGYVEAQKQYALEKHDGAEVNQYAQRIVSTSGKQDGLAWQNSDGSWAGPVGEGAAKALAEGY